VNTAGRYVCGLEANIKILRVLGCGLDSSGERQSPMADFCEHGNEHSSSIKDGESVDHPSDFSVSRNISPSSW
jgi:hypothetical protein